MFPYILKLCIPCLLGVLVSFIPVPLGVEPKGWILFSIFVATITGIILKPLPMGPVALMGLVAATLSGVLDITRESLTSLGSHTIWLIVFVFFIARGFIKTQLGTRIAYGFVSLMGRHSLGLGFGIVFTELLIAPVIPSNAARAGGIMFPIVRSIAEAFGSRPDDGTANRIGAFLIQVCFQGNLITSAMFLTAMAGNPLAQSIAAKQGVQITWTNWAIAASVPGIASLIIVTLLLYFICPPGVKKLPEAKEIAKKKLADMGPMSCNEWIMLGVFCFMLVLWIKSDTWGINSCTTALLGLCLLLITRVLDWKDVLEEHESWHVLIWLSTLVTMSSFLEKYGFVRWFSGCMGDFVFGWDSILAFLTLAIIYFYSHYFFASNTAHISSMYAAFLGVSIACGAPPLLCALVLAFFSSLFSSMTHYGTSAGAVLYGTGYVSLGKWWSIGLLVSIANLFIWFGLGGLWWKAIGLW